MDDKKIQGSRMGKQKRREEREKRKNRRKRQDRRERRTEDANTSPSPNKGKTETESEVDKIQSHNTSRIYYEERKTKTRERKTSTREKTREGGMPTQTTLHLFLDPFLGFALFPVTKHKERRTRKRKREGRRKP